jgi:hypothetical protein
MSAEIKLRVLLAGPGFSMRIDFLMQWCKMLLEWAWWHTLEWVWMVYLEVAAVSAMAHSVFVLYVQQYCCDFSVLKVQCKRLKDRA